MARSLVQTVPFGDMLLPVSQLFILRRHVYASVNIKPVSPGTLLINIIGHVIVCTRRQVQRIADLTELETVEFWCSVQEISKVISDIYKVIAIASILFRWIALRSSKMVSIRVKLCTTFTAT
jgi:bis(5'-adenosyl)-triphosphatase